jgi:urease accessory protein
MNYLLWQLADSGFPSGGFAHSNGLEAAMKHGFVHDLSTARLFSEHAVLQAARGAMPLASGAHRDPARLAELDVLADAFLSSPVANRASRAQGRSLLGAARRSFPDAPIAAIDDCVRTQALAGHHAPLFGVVMRALRVDLEDAQRLLLYTTARGVGGAAVRLGVIGAYDAQELQASLAPRIEDAALRFGDLDPLEVSQPAPLADLFQSTHDRLYSRLFQS